MKAGRVRRGLVFIAALALSGCGVITGCTSGASRRSTTATSSSSSHDFPLSEIAGPDSIEGSGAGQRRICAEVSRAFSTGPDTFVPSEDRLPGQLPATGFGPAQAECAARPGSGVYYHALVWETVVNQHSIDQFTSRLRAAGFTEKGGDGHAFTAPAGMFFADGKSQLPLNEVIVGADTSGQLRVAGFDASQERHLTTLVWV